MKQHTARVVAAIAGSLATGQSPTAIYDFADSKHHQLSGDFGPDAVNVYDYTEKCHVTGERSGGQLSLYHYGNGKHITLDDNGNGDFSGYDYDSQMHFTVSVSDASISLYDYEHARHFDYSI
jgi:hypothetical protein